MCDECKCHEHGKGLFSSIHSNISREFKGLNVQVPDDDNLKAKRKAYLKDNSLDSFLTYAEAYGFQLRYRDSLPIYEDMLKEYPDSYALHRRLAIVYMKVLMMHEAKREFEYCLDKTDDVLDVEYRLGLVHFYMHQYQESRNHFEKCFNLSKDIPDMYVATLYWFHLCCVNLQDGFEKFESYLKEYKNDFKTHPGYDLYIQLVTNKITLDEFNNLADALSELQQTCAYYGASVYFKESDPRRSKIFRHLCLSNEDYFGGFSYIAAYIDKNEIEY